MIKFTDGQTDEQTDAKGYNIIRPFFKWAYKNENSRVALPKRVFIYINSLLKMGC